MADGSDYVINLLNSKQRTARNGKPYWHGREVMEALSYRDWRDFKEVVEKARVACDMSGHFSADHFVPFPKWSASVVGPNGNART